MNEPIHISLEIDSYLKDLLWMFLLSFGVISVIYILGSIAISKNNSIEASLAQGLDPFDVGCAYDTISDDKCIMLRTTREILTAKGDKSDAESNSD